MEKVIVVMKKGMVVGIYSSIPETSISADVIDLSDPILGEQQQTYLTETIESGEVPYDIY